MSDEKETKIHTGDVYVCGNVNFSMIGKKEEAHNLTTPHSIGLTGVSKIFGGASASHFFALAGDDLYAWGRNDYGQLGLGHTMPVFKPVIHPAFKNERNADLIKSIACGKTHTIFLTNRSVFAAGSNDYGQLGIGRRSEYETRPKEITSLNALKAVSAGDRFSAFLTEAGHLFMAGCGADGRVGTGSTGEYNSAASSIKMSAEHNSTPVNIINNIELVDCGYAHTLASDKDGTVYSWGLGSYGRLGNGVFSNDNTLAPTPINSEDFKFFDSPPKLLRAGKCFNVIVLQNNFVVAWGRLRSSSEVQNKPRPDHRFQGAGTITQVSHTDNGLLFVGGEVACALGTGANKQLAISETKGSCSKPDYCATLADVWCLDAVCGPETSAFLVKPDDTGKKALDKLTELDVDALEAEYNGVDEATEAADSDDSKNNDGDESSATEVDEEENEEDEDEDTNDHGNESSATDIEEEEEETQNRMKSKKKQTKGTKRKASASSSRKKKKSKA